MSLPDLRAITPAFIDAAERARFYALPEDQQRRVRKLNWLMLRTDANHTGGRSLGAVLRGIYRAGPELAEYFTPKHATRLFAAWKNANRDWSILVDQRVCPIR